MKKQYSSLFLALLALALSGCATSFQGDSLSAIDTFPTVKPTKSIYVNLAFTGKLNGEPWKDNDRHNAAYLEDLCVEHLNDSGLFGFVSPSLKTTDLTVQVAIIHEKKTNYGEQYLATITLFLVPYKSTDTFRLLAVVTDTKTGSEKTIKLEQQVSHWQQLFMAPLSLFKNPTNQLKETRSRLLDTLCLEIYNTGLLD